MADSTRVPRGNVLIPFSVAETGAWIERALHGAVKVARVSIANATLNDGQVHYAELRDGRPVVVKVQRPNIRAQIAEDFEVLGEIALFREGPRSTDAIAQTEVELLVIKNERLDWLIRNRPQLTIEVLRRLSNWLVQSDRERTQAVR